MAGHNEHAPIPTSQPSTLTAEEERIAQAVIAAIRRIRYGSVQITVQDGRPVQFDTLEKTRLSK
jgi:hypothetical protein